MTYPGTTSLSRAHLTHLSDLLRGHRSRIGSRWRKLTAGQQALLVLAHLRNGDTYARLAAGFGVGLDRLYYSAKHHHHGVNLQGLIDPRRGDLVWISEGLPGSTHDLTAARTHGVIAAATRADVELVADKGYQGAGGTVTTPHKGRKLTKAQKAHNRIVTSVRGPGERGFAALKTWRIFTKVRCCPQRLGVPAKAVLTLELGPES